VTAGDGARPSGSAGWFAGIEHRLRDWTPRPVKGANRGWTRLYVEHVRQAHKGPDLDFLEGASGHELPHQAF
jgi:hypothetical protein